MAVKLGIIGYGIMGERLARALDRHDRTVVAPAGIWDPSEAAMTRLASDLPEMPRLGSAEAVIEAADCVYIASPPQAHISHAEAALDSGRAVFCEKPLSADNALAERFVSRIEDKGERFAVNFVFASSLAVDQIKTWIAEGAVGPVRSLEIEIGFRIWPRPWQMDASGWLSRRAEGGFTREVVSHFLFLTRRLVGPLSLGSHAVTYPDGDVSEESITAEIDAGGVPVSLSGGVGTTEKDDHNLWVLRGDNGSIRLRDWSVAERLGPDGEWRQASDAMPNEKARPLVLQRQLDKVAAMTSGGPQDLATAREALDVQQIVEAILTEE